MQRLLTARELIKLADEYTMLEHWEQARRNALMLYGEAAHKVQVNILSVWWDGRTRCDYIDKIIIYDGSDKLLWYEQFDEPIPPIEEESLSGMLEDEQYFEDQGMSTTVEDLSKFTIDMSPYEEAIPDEDGVEDSSLYEEQYMEYLAEMKQCDDSCDDAYGFPVLNATYVLDRPPSISFPLVYMQVDASTQRMLSREEVIKLGKEYKAAADWECTRAIIASTYGKNAYRAEIHYVAQCYNDEYWYGEGQETVVYDREGERLHFNPLLPIWRTEEFLDELGANAEEEWQWADAEDTQDTSFLQPLQLRPSGRLLAFDPQGTLRDGAANLATQGFFDDDNVPAWDTWISFVVASTVNSTSWHSFASYLLSWVPEPLVEVVEAGIYANPEKCIRWAADLDAHLD